MCCLAGGSSAIFGGSGLPLHFLHATIPLVSTYCFTAVQYPIPPPDFGKHSLWPQVMQLDIIILYDQSGEKMLGIKDDGVDRV